MSSETRVLIVDDEPDFCTIIQGYLKQEAVGIRTALCGKDALRILQEEPVFDVVFLDLNLPDMSGFKVMNWLSEETPDTLVVIMTGYASLESATEALRQGAHDYLTKPFAREELLKALQNAMTHKQVKEAHRLAQNALRDSETGFRHLVENILSGILIIRGNAILYQNPVQRDLFGPVSQVLVNGDYRAIDPDDIEKMKDIARRFLKKEIAVAETDFRFYVSKPTDGSRESRWVLSRATRISYQGNPAVLINTMDITRLKELERLIIIKNKMHSLGRVAAGVAHEIRNPLTGINSYLFSLGALTDAGMASQADAERAREMIRQMQTASDKIESVIHRVMDFARPGVPLMALTNVNLALQDAIKLSEVTLRKSGIELITDFASQISACYADRQLIEQVMMNLINNAVHALECAAPPLRLRIASHQRDGKVILQVEDSGPGIPEGYREKIFDPFFTTKDDGAGIGLNIVQRIVADHHGNITVSKGQLGGALFTIELPVDRRSPARC